METTWVCPGCGKTFEGIAYATGATAPCPDCGVGLFVPGELDSSPTNIPSATTGAPAEVVSPPDRIGPYELLGLLGRGGMGVVYRARHSQLGTTCAVKVLAGGAFASAAALARFRREASAVARMGKHANIVSVHDLGEQGGVAYFAMELVEGKSLRQLLREGRLPWAQAARLVEKVSRALHFAHTHGVVHRDVKPENILLREDGEPQVADFGLAREVLDPMEAPLTRTGEVFGTPNYMAPEQVRGETGSIDARTDVYALGAVLYEVLAGCLAFGGESEHEVHGKILRGEVLPPRAVRADVPRDLETICLKCLAPERERRYQTAETLAEDLALFRAGEPIRARPEGIAGRWSRRVRRHKTVTALVAALVVVASIAGVFLWKAHRENLAESERRAEAERDRAAAIEEALRSLTLRGRDLVEAGSAWRAAGDLARCKATMGHLREPIEELRRKAPDLAESWYYEGWLEMIQDRPDKAEAAMTRAIELASSPKASGGSKGILPVAFYERGMLRARRRHRLWEERRLELLRSRGAGLPFDQAPPPPTAADVDAAFADVAAVRQEAIADLQAGLALGFRKSPAREPGARGILALLDGDLAGAEKALAESLAKDTHLVEIYGTLAALFEEKGDWATAADWYRRGHDADRGYVPHLEGLAYACIEMAKREQDRGERERAGGLRREAQEALAKALGQDSRAVRALELRSELHLDEAEAVGHAGQDPTDALDRALLAADDAIAVDPASRRAMAVRAMVHYERAMRAGEGAGPHLAKMMEAAEALAKAAPDSTKAVIDLALAHELLGEHALAHGRDPSAEYGAAIEGYERAIGLDPRSLAAAVNLGNVLGSLGRYELTRWKDPAGRYDRARKAFDRAAELAPLSPAVANGLGCLLESLGKSRAARGKDPLGTYREAMAAFSHALDLDPTFAEAMVGRGNAWTAIAKWQRDHGADPAEAFREARASLDASVAANPSYALGHTNLANLRVTIGDWERQAGRDATGEYEGAVAGFDRAITLDPSIWQAHLGRAMALEGLGRYEEAIAAGEEARKLVGNAVPMVGEVLGRVRAKLRDGK